MARSSRREFLPFVVELDEGTFEVHADGKVYRRVVTHTRLRQISKLSETFRTEETTLRRVKDRDLVAKAKAAAAGTRWTRAVGV